LADTTISKGIFYEGYKKAAGQGKSPGTRSMQTVTAADGKKESAKGRMLYPASAPNTADKMRKPF